MADKQGKRAGRQASKQTGKQKGRQAGRQGTTEYAARKVGSSDGINTC